MLKAPFRLEGGWLRRFGYPGERRFVGLFWEPSGDEACYDDGISYACGMSDNWLYLGFIRQPHVHRWLEKQSLNLGNSDESAPHWLIADALTGELYAAPCREAVAIIRAQQLPSSSGQGDTAS